MLKGQWFSLNSKILIIKNILLSLFSCVSNVFNLFVGILNMKSEISYLLRSSRY